MSILVNLLIASDFSWIVFILGGAVFFCILLATSISIFLEEPSRRNLYAMIGFVITIGFGFTFYTIANTGKDILSMQEIYKAVSLIEVCPFDNLSDGNINGVNIKVSKNILYKEDKLVYLERFKYKFEVENHKGQSKVVAVFLDEKEIDFP